MAKTKTAKTFLVSDESKNCYGFRVLNSGIETSAFEANPVMLYMHQRGKVFGSWSNLTLANGKWTAESLFDIEDTDKDVQDVAGKVERGFLKAASIGIDIQAVEWNEELACYDVVACVLQEISIVDVGGNRNAVRLYSNGQPLSEVQLKDKLATLSAPPATNEDTIKSIVNTPVHMELKAIAKSLGLPETATEQEVQDAAVRLSADSGYKKKFDELEATLSSAKVTEANDLVDAAIADKRITADQKPTYVKLFAADFDSTKAILLKMAKPVDLVQLTNQNNVTVTNTDEEAAKLYESMDRKGTLAKLKADNPTEFNRLFAAKFGKQPKA